MYIHIVKNIKKTIISFILKQIHSLNYYITKFQIIIVLNVHRDQPCVNQVGLNTSELLQNNAATRCTLYIENKNLPNCAILANFYTKNENLPNLYTDIL